MDLRVTTAEHGPVTLVEVTGDIDVYSAPILREALDRVICGGRINIVLDLEGVTFLDSTALGVLVGRLKLVRLQQGSLRMVCTVPRILRILEITGLNKVFPLHVTLDSALEASHSVLAG